MPAGGWVAAALLGVAPPANFIEIETTTFVNS